MFQPPITCNKRIEVLVSSVLLFFCAAVAAAQSTSLEYPTPVTGNEISGVITARDIGDSRLTRHFFLLSGTTGDLTVTVQYSNLDGDLDLFTADTMRPLAKIGMVAGDRPISVGRTVFLRLEEKLILRIEARTANDDPGQYRVNFSGTFLALAAQDAPPDDPQVTSKSSTTSRRHVTSAGQVIVEPEPPPVAKVEPPKPTPPTPKPKLTAKTGRGPSTAPAKTPAPAGSATRTANTRGKRPVRKPPPAKTPPPADGETTAPTESTETAETAETAAPPANPTPAPVARRRGSTRRGATTRAPAPEPAPDPMANARLVVETRDGMRREHFMRDVRRFSVERGLLLVLLKDGTSEREPMSNVLKVTIEP